MPLGRIDLKKIAFVTGAAGFTGSVLVEELVEAGYDVYGIVRPGSAHNSRLDIFGDRVHRIDLDLDDISKLPSLVPAVADGKRAVFFHLAWTSGKDCERQFENVGFTLEALRVAAKIGCKRFVCTGSQAEYGVVPKDELICEDRMLNPFSAYGASKVAACYTSRSLANELGVEWIWGRIFSVIGKHEPAGRMLPDLYESLKRGENFKLSSCRQNWDYLDVYDAADALVALGERGVNGEIYNIAHGDYKSLREFTEELRIIVNPDAGILYGDDASPFVSLQPSVEKIQRDTGWKAMRGLEESVKGWEY